MEKITQSAVSLYDSANGALGLIIIEASKETIITTLSTYSALGAIEGIGGFAVVLIFIVKFFVSGIERRMLESELIEQFYQVDKSLIEGDYKADELRSDPAPVIPLNDDFNTSKQALKNRKKAV